MDVKTWRAMLETVGKFPTKKKSKKGRWSTDLNDIQRLARVSVSKKGAAEIVVSDLNHREATAVSDGYKPKGAKAICVDPKRLLATLKKLPLLADVAVSVDDVSLHIAVPEARYSGQFAGSQADDFATIPATAMNDLCLFTKGELRSMQYVLGAATDDDTRPTLCGMLLAVNDAKTMVAVATDTHRLAIVDDEFGEVIGTPHPGPFILHKSWLTPMLKLGITKANVDDGVTLRANEYGTTVEASYATDWGTARFATRAIDGQYPGYAEVIPPDDAVETTIVVDTEALRSAIGALKSVWAEDAGRVGFSVEDGMLRMKANSGGYDNAPSESTMLLEAEMTGNLEFDYSLNAKYLLVAMWGKDETRIRLTGRLSPAMVDAEGHLTIVMPMQK